MTFLKKLCSAILAGIMISFGGAVYLACENKIVGAVLFSLGLTVILINSFSLFTGKTGYVCHNKPSYLLDLLLTWVGNIIGCILMGFLVKFAKPTLGDTANELCTKKLSQTPIQTILLGILCGVLVYIAVDYFKFSKTDKEFTKYILIFTCVPAFIICGFEHSVADMFYFAATNANMLFTGKGIIYILLVSLGNLIGAILFHELKTFTLKKI